SSSAGVISRREGTGVATASARSMVCPLLVVGEGSISHDERGQFGMMTDTDEYIVSVVRVMQLANWHTYQVLTKRSERMRDMLETKLKFAAALPHIWWGVSVENKKHGLQRIDHLQASPAKIRFLSIEPLLEDIGRFSLTGINWVIVGGESGAGARPMKKSWVLSIRDQCQKATIPFFFKQWGGVRKNEAGRSLDGKTYNEFPQRAEAPVMDQQRRLIAIEKIESLRPAGALH
ncbi:MAG: DUF5131 family protein, partial [Nitrospirota bacterium]|nr:DUF5131 family protein [Nitrospirota bacterium]